MSTALRRGVSGAALAAAAVCATAGPAFAGDWRFDGLGLRNERADFKVGLTGYVQFDSRHYAGWTSADPEGKPLADSLDARRARTGLELGWRKLSAQFVMDWSGDLRDLLDDGGVAYPGAEIKDLYAQYELSKAFALKAGTFKVPVSPEFLTSSGKTDFVERSMLASLLGPDREWGVAAVGELGKRVAYQAGVFAGDGRTSTSRAETTYAARAVWGATRRLDVGASFAQGDVEPEPDGLGTDPSPKGFQGRSPTGFRFYDRKFVSGRRQRLGLDAAWTRGPWSLKGEWLQGREQRRGQGSTLGDLPDMVGRGFSVTASWIVTGDKKVRTLKPARPLPKGPGLVEVAARYEEVRFDDAGPDEGFEGAGNRARNLRPAGNRVLWAGVSWLPVSFVRLYANLLLEEYRDPLLAPEPPGTRGLDHPPHQRGGYVTFVARLQFIVP